MRPGGAIKGRFRPTLAARTAACFTGCQHPLRQLERAFERDDGADRAGALHQRGNRSARQEARAAPNAVVDKQPCRGGGLDGALFRDMQGEVGRLGEAGLEMERFAAVDATDAVAPGAMLAGITFELRRRQIPEQAARPAERDIRQPRLQVSSTPPWRGFAAGNTARDCPSSR